MVIGDLGRRLSGVKQTSHLRKAHSGTAMPQPTGAIAVADLLNASRPQRLHLWRAAGPRVGVAGDNG